MTTEILNKGPELTDEQMTARIDELNRQESKGDLESQELDTLKKERSTRYQERITKLTSKNKEFEYQRDTASQEAERLRKENEELRNKQVAPQPAPIVEDTVIVDGKQHYTDQALISMRDSGRINDDQAWKLQQARKDAESDQRILSRLENTKKKTQEEEAQDTMRADIQKVLAEHPELDPKHPNHDKKDPFIASFNDVYYSGYNTNIKGASKAVELVNKMLGKNKNLDLSQDLSVNSPTIPFSQERKSTEVVLSETEKDIAIRMYTLGEVTNPKTGRAYTEAEAIEKAKAGKRKQMESRTRRVN